MSARVGLIVAIAWIREVASGIGTSRRSGALRILSRSVPRVRRSAVVMSEGENPRSNISSLRLRTYFWAPQ